MEGWVPLVSQGLSFSLLGIRQLLVRLGLPGSLLWVSSSHRVAFLAGIGAGFILGLFTFRGFLFRPPPASLAKSHIPADPVTLRPSGHLWSRTPVPVLSRRPCVCIVLTCERLDQPPHYTFSSFKHAVGALEGSDTVFAVPLHQSPKLRGTAAQPGSHTPPCRSDEARGCQVRGRGPRIALCLEVAVGFLAGSCVPQCSSARAASSWPCLPSSSALSRPMRH